MMILNENISFSLDNILILMLSPAVKSLFLEKYAKSLFAASNLANIEINLR